MFVGDGYNEDAVGLLAKADCDIKDKLMKINYFNDIVDFNLYNNNNLLIDDFILNR